MLAEHALDVERNLRRDAPDPLVLARQYRWPAGQNRGKLLADLDTSFLQWAEKNTYHDDVREMCRAVLQFRAAEALAEKARDQLAPASLDELVYLIIRLADRVHRLESALRAHGIDELPEVA